MEPLVYIVILNWNGCRDTIECLHSIFHNTYSNYRVIICDNNSQDGSIEYIKAWAEGRLQIEFPVNSPVYHLPSIPKPISYIEYTRKEALAKHEKNTRSMILLHTGGNLGYAGGNNMGIRYALNDDEAAYIWLLNNDTVVDAQALGQLVHRMREKPDAGICGSTLLYYYHPDTVQALGGATYHKWSGFLRLIGSLGSFSKTARKIQMEKIEQQMDFVVGTSMLVSKPFLQDIGLMSEDYFLYYEELDWALRAYRRYSLTYSPKSIVYHKDGRSIGAGNLKCGEKSKLSDYYFIRNRLLITRKFFPYALPIVYLWLLASILNRMRRGQWDRIEMIARIALETKDNHHHKKRFSM